MRRKFIDLLAKRAGMLTEAEALLKDGQREAYRAKMAEIGNLNGEITTVKALLDEMDRKFMERPVDPAEERDKAAERAGALLKGMEVKFEPLEVLKSITVATATLAQPTGAGSEIRGGNAPISSVIDQVRVTNLAGVSEYQEPYVLTELDATGGTIATTAGTKRTESSDPTFAVAQIKPYELAVTTFVDRNTNNLSPADYYAKIYGMAMRAMRRKCCSLILNGDATTSTTFFGMKTAKNKEGAAIYATENVTGIDVNLLDTLYFSYGADTELGGGQRLYLTKRDLKAIGQLRGTNEKRRLFEVVPNGNTGTIRDGGVSIPYTLCADGDLTSLSTATAGGSAIQTMIYADPQGYELGLFSPFTVRVDESYKAQERLLTILGDAMVGGNLIYDKAAVIATVAAS